MGRLWLDELLFGKEVLDRWDTKRNGQEFSSEFLTLVERNKMNYSKEKTLKKIRRNDALPDPFISYSIARYRG